MKLFGLIIISLLLLSCSPITKNIINEEKIYTLEIERWNISNDGTNPINTTVGFNRALKWANNNNYNIFKVPEGEYLIDKNAHIKMVNNITFELENNAVIMKEANSYEEYTLIYIGPGVNNVTLKGGIYKGDKNEHDYSTKDNQYTAGTHESGYGILAVGAENLTIDGITAMDFTGDGLCVCAKVQAIAPWLLEEDFVVGGIDKDGQLIEDPQKIRTNNIEKTNFNHPIFNTIKTFQFSRPENLDSDVSFDVFFYNNKNNVLRSVTKKELDWSLIDIPTDATYYHAVFNTHSYQNLKLEFWAKTISKDVVIKNSRFAFNRRQGITVGGVDNLLIENNEIHDNKGTAPQSGIDVEAGFAPNDNIIIRSNKFFNNDGYNIILYDGRNAIVEENYLGPNQNKTSIGLAVSTPFLGATIRNNFFEGSSLHITNNADVINNKMNNSSALFIGPNVKINNLELINSTMQINSEVPFGVNAKNVHIINNKKKQTALSINGKPIHLKNITIKGESSLRNLIGQVSEGSIFDNLKVIGFNSEYGIDLPSGTYNNCFFESAEGGINGLEINQPGLYSFNSCNFRTNRSALTVNHEEAVVSILDSKFESLYKNGYGISLVHIGKAQKVEIINSIFDSKLNADHNFKHIKIGGLNGNKLPTQVYEASIIGNSLFSRINVEGISTVEAGFNSPEYVIQDNILYNAKLNIKNTDKNINNLKVSQN